jgi:hypothetical protein
MAGEQAQFIRRHPECSAEDIVVLARNVGLYIRLDYVPRCRARKPRVAPSPLSAGQTIRQEAQRGLYRLTCQYGADQIEQLLQQFIISEGQ